MKFQFQKRHKIKVHEYPMTHLCKNLADIEELKCTFGCNKSYGFFDCQKSFKTIKEMGYEKTN